MARGGNPIRNGITIIGREKSIEYHLRNDVTIYNKNTETIVRRVLDQSITHSRAFLDAVKKNDPTAVRSPYPDALKSLLLADAANRSMETGQVVKL